MKKICFFIQTPLTKRDYNRFGAELLGKSGFEVSFLDMTDVMNPQYRKHYKPVKEISVDNVKVCGNYGDIERFLKDNRGLFGIDMIGARVGNVFFYKLLKRYDIQYASFCANSIPVPSFSNAAKLNFITNGKIILGKAVWRMANLFLGLQSPAFILAGGVKYARKRPRPGKSTEIIWAHTLDYDLYLDYSSRNPGPIIEGPYAVFLDEYFPLHPDYYICTGMYKNPFRDSAEYYASMNIFFSRFEGKIGMPVVIAAHPASHYEGTPGIFEGRRIIKHDTIGLVAHASHVLAHASTSINFAVLFRKPISFVTLAAMNRTQYGPFIANFSRQFGRPVINADDDAIARPDRAKTNEERLYKKYIEDFIKTEKSPQIPFWQIVGDRVRTYN
ncbi:MAG: hypothetical protein PHQ91_13585 [Thermoanaerobaculaceae bacterium]|nr:hypothetical protein [Thermoanaerobaculaceae bacterium]